MTEACDFCGKHELIETMQWNRFPHGAIASDSDVVDHVVLKAYVPVISCESCGEEWTDHRAERLRDAVARKYSKRIGDDRQAVPPRATDDLVQRLAKSLSVFTKHHDSWMDKRDDDKESSTFSRHTFGELRTALKLIDEAGRPASDRPSPTADQTAILAELAEAASELAQFASYAEIVGAVLHNRQPIRKWCDEVFRLGHQLDDAGWQAEHAADHSHLNREKHA
jgi:hypothetical protein